MYFFCQLLYAYPQGSGTYRTLLTVSDFFFFFFPRCLSLPIAKLMRWREPWQGHWTQYHWGHKGQGMDGGTWWWNSISKQRPGSRLHLTERTSQTPCESRSRCFLFPLHSLAPPPSASSPGRRQPQAALARGWDGESDPEQHPDRGSQLWGCLQCSGTHLGDKCLLSFCPLFSHFWLLWFFIYKSNQREAAGWNSAIIQHRLTIESIAYKCLQHPPVLALWCWYSRRLKQKDAANIKLLLEELS